MLRSDCNLVQRLRDRRNVAVTLALVEEYGEPVERRPGVLETIAVAVGTVVFALVLIVGAAGGAWAQEPECDAWSGLVPAETYTDRVGCVMEVRYEPGRESLALFAGVLVVGCLGAIVVTTGWRS